jgi:ectoine hydroxylase-related dioxygenase (phytanoyl-CoA dioxygenase family)
MAASPTFAASLGADGFAVIDHVLDTEEIGALSRALAHSLVIRTRAGARHALGNPAVAALASDPRLAHLARDVLGSSAIPFRATLFDKSPAANWLVVWHQDTALPLQSRLDAPGWGPWSVKSGITYAHAPTRALDRVVAIRVHLDDSTSLNGPLRVLPGSHKYGVLSDEAVQKLAREREPLDCVVAKGGVLVMRPLLIHSSSKARSDAPRRVLHIEYSVSMSAGDGLELAVA